MNWNAYVGCSDQLFGVEEVRLTESKGAGLHLLQLRNAAGLSVAVAADRCADLYRLSFRGCNIGYFAPCGYVAPTYYQEARKGFLKSFTAGFLTTCGLNNVGAPAMDNGEELPLHGTVGNTPCEEIRWTETEDALEIHAKINVGTLFGEHLLLHRCISCGKFENTLRLSDTIENCGGIEAPVRLMYHCNMGYPLLTEDAQIDISSTSVEPFAAEAVWKQILPPQPTGKEQCYRHYFADTATASIYNPAIRKGVRLRFDPKDFPCLIQWKLFLQRDYALGLEPRNCAIGNRTQSRLAQDLTVLQPGQQKTYQLEWTFFE